MYKNKNYFKLLVKISAPTMVSYIIRFLKKQGLNIGN